MPAGHPDQQRPLGELLVVVQVLAGVAREKQALAVEEDVLQGEVDGPDGAMEVDRAEQFGADADETDQGGEAPLVDGQPLGREDGVVQQAVQIEGPGAVARHVGVAEHEVHVVDRIQAAEKAPQEPQPARDLLVVALLGPDDERGDLLGSSVSPASRPLWGLRRTARNKPARSRRMISTPRVSWVRP